MTAFKRDREDWRFMEVPRGTPCRFFDRDVERWLPAVVIRWLPGQCRSVTVERGSGDTAIRYTVGKSRVRLVALIKKDGSQ